MEKMYQVFYTIKKDRGEELNHKFIFANNSKEAITRCEKLYLKKQRNTSLGWE